jgi:nicotinamidase-related amidase
MAHAQAADGFLETLQAEIPVAAQVFETTDRTGLVIVDEVNGFASVGAGPLAPPVENPQVTGCVAETVRVARAFADLGRPIAAFLDTHVPGKPEPPYPPHCEVGTGQEDLVAELQWLSDHPGALLIRKDCINGFVGAIDIESGANRIVDWVNHNRLEAVVAVGICTDVCVMDFVLTMISARNHGMMPTLRDVVVLEPGCATYDLSAEVAAAQDLPETARHPQAATHYLGLYFMAARGAVLASAVR